MSVTLPPPAPPPPPPASLALWAYLGVTRLLAGLGPRVLRRRLAAGKEDPARWREKLGEATLARPAGRLIWVHAVSVGEGLSVLPLLGRLARDGRAVLLTCTTVTAARLIAGRVPPGVLVQFLPLDLAPGVTRFLDHWRPDVAVMVESEFWPRLIWQVHGRGIPLVLANARMSDASFARWRRMRGLAAAMIGRFTAFTAPDAEVAGKLIALGADPGRVAVTGSLKGGAERLPVNATALAEMREAVAGRASWLAASTHPGEDEVVAEALLRMPDRVLLILAPRHPQRAGEIRAMLAARGLAVAQRSAGEPITPETRVYLADTLGEMGLWFDLCPVAFIGGSLVAVGGHNAYEPALHGAAILHGPEVRNFADLYARLTAAGGAEMVRDAAGLAAAVARMQADEAARAAMVAAARGVVEAEAGDEAISATAGLILGLVKA